MTEVRTPASDDGAGEASSLMTPGHAFRVALPNFEGPLDLLLHLIREHKLDIFDIPISLITEKYLESLERMKEVNLDIAGEFLVMASTLAHIKSRLLLPHQEAAAGSVQAALEAEEERDPRGELVRRLLEYQKYKEAAVTLSKRHLLERDVFPRRVNLEELVIPSEETGLVEISVYKLIEALDRVLKERMPIASHEVVRERVSLTAAMARITDVLQANGTATFFSLFDATRTRQQIIITFLALLELCKLRLVRVHQAQDGDDIMISPQGDALAGGSPPEVDESEYR